MKNTVLKNTTQGVVYSPANKSDKEFIAKKLDKEYGSAVDRLSRPFAYNEELKKDLMKKIMIIASPIIKL